MWVADGLEHSPMEDKKMNSEICPGHFCGGDIEPGTFHAEVNKDN